MDAIPDSARWPRADLSKKSLRPRLIELLDLLRADTAAFQFVREPKRQRQELGFGRWDRPCSRRLRPEHFPELRLADAELVRQDRLEAARAHRLRGGAGNLGDQDLAVEQRLGEV